LADSLFQIFGDGAAYQGRIKALCHEVIKLHYRDKLNPEIQHCHNSSQREEAIADIVKKLIDESLFL
jgi:hypothetical protein